MQQVVHATCRFCTSFTAAKILAPFLILALGGCRDTLWRLPEVHVSLKDVPLTRVERNRQWRNVQIVPAGNPVVIDVSLEKGSKVLQFGTFTEMECRSGLSFTIEDEARNVIASGENAAGEWKDFRFDLRSVLPQGEGSIRALFRSDSPFCLYGMGTSSVSESSSPNVVVFLIDTLRKDHVGAYGYKKRTTPHIDRFTLDSVRLVSMFANSSWTRPSVCSLFSSVYPPFHGAQEKFDYCSSSGPTIASVLNDAGYETYCFMTNPQCLPEWSIGGDFDRYIDIDSLVHIPDQDDKNVVDAAIRALDEVPDRPSFMYIHTMSPHWPYSPPDEHIQRIRGELSFDGEPKVANGSFEEGTEQRIAGWAIPSLDGVPAWQRTDQKSKEGGYSLMSAANIAKPGELLYAESEAFDVRENDLISVSGYVSSYNNPDRSATIGIRAFTNGSWQLLSNRAWAVYSNAWQRVEDCAIAPPGTTKVSIGLYAPRPESANSGWFVDNVVCTARPLTAESDGEAEYRRRIVDLYDAEIAYVDEQFGRFLDALKSRNLYDNTLIVLIADHGEEFWEHGDTDHGKTLYDEVLSVPCVIKYPQQLHRGTSETKVAEIIDLGPTILDNLALSVPAEFQGESLLPVSEDGAPSAKALRYAFLKLDGRDLGSVKSLSESLIVDYKKHADMQFDLSLDPQEGNPAAALDQRGIALKSNLERILNSAATGLHLHMSFDASKDTELRGILHGAGEIADGLRASGYPVDIEQSPGETRFSISFKSLPTEVLEPGFVRNRPEHQSHVDFVIPVTSSADFQLSIEKDGTKLLPDEISGGREGVIALTEAGALDLPALAASTRDVEARIRADRFGVYVWYVPPPTTATAEEVDPEMTDALRALGYLD